MKKLLLLLLLLSLLLIVNTAQAHEHYHHNILSIRLIPNIVYTYTNMPVNNNNVIYTNSNINIEIALNNYNMLMNNARNAIMYNRKDIAIINLRQALNIAVYLMNVGYSNYYFNQTNNVINSI